MIQTTTSKPKLSTSLGGTVEKNIPEEKAVTALIDLIKQHGDWVEKN